MPLLEMNPSEFLDHLILQILESWRYPSVKILWS